MLDSAIFYGAMGATIAGIVAFLLKDLPISFSKFLVQIFTTSIIIRNEDDAFTYFVEWCSQLVNDKYTRKLQLFERKEDGTWSTTIGPGKHLFWWGWKPYIIRREILEKEGLDKIKETFGITFLGRSHKHINDLLQEVTKTKTAMDRTKIYTHSYWWQLSGSREIRKLTSIILPKKQIEKITDQIDFFLQNKDVYTKRSIPYKLNVLFHGPPGTGKTSFILALAGYLKKHVYVINLQSIEDDDKLIYAIINVPKDAVILMEDVDAVDCTTDRSIDTDNQQTRASLSCLLNILDGVFAHENRILFMTTNHIDKLDPALIRPGRVDIFEKIDLLSQQEIEEFYLRFFTNDKNAKHFATQFTQPVSGAALQQYFIANMTDESSCLDNYRELLCV